MMTNKQLVYKFNSIRIARDHKKHCNKECAVSLGVLMEMCEKLGIKFRDDEKKYFI